MHRFVNHYMTNVLYILESLCFKVLNTLVDVLFFDPNENHAIFHHGVGYLQFLEVFDGHSLRLALGKPCFVGVVVRVFI